MTFTQSVEIRYVKEIAELNAENQKLKKENKHYKETCQMESRDPNGTIWEVAEKMQKELGKLKTELAASEAIRKDLSDQANDYKRLYEIAVNKMAESKICPYGYFGGCSDLSGYEGHDIYVVCHDCIDKYFREQLRKEKEGK